MLRNLMAASPAAGGGAAVITVHSPAGGTGKTLVSLYLAYMYAHKGLSVVLLDLSQYGTVAPWLRIPRSASTGVTGLLAAFEQGGIADERVQGTMIPAPESGDRVHLVLSSGPAKMDQVSALGVEVLIGHLARAAQVVIIDTGSELTDRTLGALAASTGIALTVNPQVATGWQVLELLELSRSAHIPRDRFGVVFNRVQPGSKYGLEEYQQVLDLPVWGTIPEAPELRQAVDQGGAPAIQGRRRGVVALRQLAHRLIPAFSPEELRRPWPWSK